MLYALSLTTDPYMDDESDPVTTLLVLSDSYHTDGPAFDAGFVRGLAYMGFDSPGDVRMVALYDMPTDRHFLDALTKTDMSADHIVGPLSPGQMRDQYKAWLDEQMED